MKRFAFLVAAAMTASIATAAPLGVHELFESLARAKPGRATFHEKKFVALLDKPVESTGELVFTPPSRMEKRTTSPRVESVIVDGDLVTLERGGRKQSLRLREHPAIAVLVESIRATLAGDLASLTKTYSTGLAGDAAQWRLTLRPLDPSLGTLVERLEIAGSGAQVRTVEIFQADGDRSVMTLTPVAK
ncbi:MAG TPA: LolA-related protein [Usitatibacter sp.]|nr:LolA-related protein [Usitatibacter sp.]